MAKLCSPRVHLAIIKIVMVHRTMGESLVRQLCTSTVQVCVIKAAMQVFLDRTAFHPPIGFIKNTIGLKPGLLSPTNLHSSMKEHISEAT